MLLTDEEKALLARAPKWLLQPLPPSSTRDDALIQKLKEHLDRFEPVHALLDEVCTNHAYPVAANLTSVWIWEELASWVGLQPKSLLVHAEAHMTRVAELRVIRRLAKHPNTAIRRNVLKRIRDLQINETMLPSKHARDNHPWRAGLGRVREQAAFRRADRSEVQQLGLPEIETVGQLREELRIKSENQLGWFLQASAGESKPYFCYEIPKRNGKQREICAPNWQLRRVQQNILRKILGRVPVHECAHGFVPKRSIVTNAQPHVGKKLVLKFDLQDFFPTITYSRVIGLFTSLGFFGATVRFSRDDDSYNVSPTLARLCVYAHNPKEWVTAYCPQGAPTSPAISNLICRGLDARLHGLAEAMSGNYTRYADDLTFSFSTNEVNIGRFRWWVDQICHQEGFYVNHRKFRLMRASRRQSVTGVVVNDCLRVPREQRRRLRAIVHDAERNGIEAAARGRTGFAAWLRGYVAFVHMVHPEEGSELMERVRKLTAFGNDEAGRKDSAYDSDGTEEPPND